MRLARLHGRNPYPADPPLCPLPPALPPAQSTQPRGVIEVSKCLSIKGAEDAINRPHAFEVSTHDTNMYFIADSDKARRAGGGAG